MILKWIKEGCIRVVLAAILLYAVICTPLFWRKLFMECLPTSRSRRLYLTLVPEADDQETNVIGKLVIEKAERTMQRFRFLV